MSSEVRQSVVDAAALTGPITLRGLVEWYKRAIGALAEVENATIEEMSHVDKGWGIYISELATTLEVPVGWLSAAVYELAEWEMRLAATAAAEGGAENFEAETTETPPAS